MSDDPFDKSGGHKAVSFALHGDAGMTSKPIGTRIGGLVLEAPKLVQSRGYAGTPFAGKPLFWDNLGKGKKTDEVNDAQGNPNKKVEDIVILLQVDGESMALWCPFYPKYMYEAIQAAKAGRAIEAGDQLYVTLTGFERREGSNPTAAPSKTYSAEFIKGDAFTMAAAVAATGAVAPPPPPPGAAAPPPPPPAPVAAPADPHKAERDAHLGAGWTLESLAANGKGHLLPPAAPAPVAAPPPPPAPPVAAPPPPPPAPAAPPPPPAPPADPNAAQRQAYLDGGWTMEQIAANAPHLLPPATAAAGGGRTVKRSDLALIQKSEAEAVAEGFTVID